MSSRDIQRRSQYLLTPKTIDEIMEGFCRSQRTINLCLYPSSLYLFGGLSTAYAAR